MSSTAQVVPRTGLPRRIFARLWRWFRPPRRVRPTAMGWAVIGILVAILFGALNSGNNLLYLLLSVLFATIAMSGVLSETSIRKVRLEVDFPRSVTAGEDFSFVVRFENTSRWRRAWILSCDPAAFVPKESLAIAELRWLAHLLPASGKKPAHALLWQQAKALRRGVFQIEEGYLVTQGPFGLFDRRKRVPLRKSLAVLPRSVPVDLPPIPAPPAGGEIVSRDRGEGFDLRSIRPYEASDPARRIAWRASARAGELLVRETQAEERRRVEVSLDPWRERPPAPLLDRQAGAARYACEELLRRGYAVRLGTAHPFVSTQEELSEQLIGLAEWNGEVREETPVTGKAVVLRILTSGRVAN